LKETGKQKSFDGGQRNYSSGSIGHQSPGATAGNGNIADLTPPQIVAELDKYIVGQTEAKRAVAVALRNRYRRQQLAKEVRDEIAPKNIMMIGPTGVGKTEIARRMAKLVDAPFVKVEATKFTEVGYVGRDVESIVRDLIEVSISMVHDEKVREVQTQAEVAANEKLINFLVQELYYKKDNAKDNPKNKRGKFNKSHKPGLTVLTLHTNNNNEAALEDKDKDKDKPAEVTAADNASNSDETSPESQLSSEELEVLRRRRKRVAVLLRQQKLEDKTIEIDLDNDEPFGGMVEFVSGMNDDNGESIHDLMENLSALTRRRSRRVSVKEARRLLTHEEANKLVDFDGVVEASVERAEELGVVFLDEVDKIVGNGNDSGPDVSGEGVQRDLLPIVEGSTVMTRYGPVKTDHVLFIAAGAFHNAKPSDLIPELQGRFPLRVELDSLEQPDLKAILTQPNNALTRQYTALLDTEGVKLEFQDEGLEEIAQLAYEINVKNEDIGARRLHTIMERVLEDISFEAADHKGETVVIDRKYVEERVGDLAEDEDLSKFIL
jgi:ATP-dependent HslUV protease ATP-binding subunit HslU